MKRNRTVRRRATVLIMVVTLLALLFVIVSGYLTLARFDRQTLIIAQQGNTADEIVDGVNDLLLSLVREQWADDNGELLTGADPEEYAYEDIPGYRQSHWLAAAEPVVDKAVAGNAHPLEKHRLAAISALGELEPNDPLRQPSVSKLMLENDRDNDPNLNFNLNDPTNDLLRNARLGFMDADGDGMPDAGLLASGVATELANTMAGTSVRLRGTGIDPSAIPQDGDPSTTLDDFWRRYNDLARYEVAVRVVPHGGMVALSSPGQYATGQVWNREFVTGMFNWIRKGPDALGAGRDDLFNGLSASAAAVEPYLRRRGGLLPSYRTDDQNDFGRIPDALRDWEREYGGTFLPRFAFGMRLLKDNNWQRFNLSDTEELFAWRLATYLDPLAYNNPITRSQAMGAYDRRHQITAVSCSDDLAREQTSTLPGAGRPGLWPGQLKFYLGKITDPTIDPSTGRPRGAFDENGYYQAIEGPRIVHELAGYFHEMLSAYTDWPDWPDRPGWTALTDEEKRFRQAYMLAVNAVAFAAPRTQSPFPPYNDGFIDVVTCAASSAGSTTSTTYIGCAPEPFITQVMVYDDEDDPNDQDLALAIELYNPNDPTQAGPGNDNHALDLSQFCITVNNVDPNLNPELSGMLSGLTVPVLGRMDGRSFVAFGFRGSLNDNRFFDGNLPNGSFEIFNLDVNFPSGSLTVRLWRLSYAGAWYLVDELEVEEVTPEPDQEWWTTTYRDTRDEQYFGDYGVVPPLAARWRMAVNFSPSGVGINEDSGTGAPVVTELGQAGPETTGVARGPTLPLYTMNAAALNDWPVHGALRPRSFPTPGFVLFVPRFSHTKEAQTPPPPATVLHRPISSMLQAVWEDENYGFDFTSQLPPADFGHMPIFDNRQDLDSGGYGDYFDDDEAGKVPWGLLVFDYFTTLNPNGADGLPNTSDDIDPYRVPGRININAAPWYVLAGSPLIGPTAADADGDGSPDLPLDPSASPAFWGSNSGIVLGVGGDGTVRFIGDVPDPNQNLPFYNPGTGWYCLGPHLAQSAAAYRDGIQYVALSGPGYTVYADAWRRNGAGALPYRDGVIYGQFDGTNHNEIRGAPENAADPLSHFGYLSLGEVANVKGFDSATFNADGSVYSSPLANPMLDPAGGDFIKAVSLLALLDTHFLTTRSNTFTAYVTVTDRQKPQQSVRSQITVDRSNILPRLVLDANGDPIIEDPDGAGPEPAQAVVITKDGLPEVIAERRVGYYNARFDD